MGRHTSLSHSASLFYDGQEEDKESGNSDCILLSHLEINEATHKKGGEIRERFMRNSIVNLWVRRETCFEETTRDSRLALNRHDTFITSIIL